MTMKWRSLVFLGAILQASPALAGLPKSCLDIHLQNPPPWWYVADGEYTIEPRPGTVFSVYCHGMNGWAPADYLTLPNNGGDLNFAQYTAGGSAPGTSVRTSFTKVRIDPNTLLFDIGDLTFATSTGAVDHGNTGTSWIFSAPFGVALDCKGAYSQDGIANIDLTGTPFKVEATLFAHGSAASGSVTTDGETFVVPPNELPGIVSGKVLTVHGGGGCGSVGPQGFNSLHRWWLTPQTGMLALQLRYVGQ